MPRLMLLLTVCARADVCCVHLQHPAQAKVGYLAAEAARITCTALQQHVACLQVAVHHANRVQVVETRGSVQQRLVHTDLSQAEYIGTAQTTQFRFKNLTVSICVHVAVCLVPESTRQHAQTTHAPAASTLCK